MIINIKWIVIHLPVMFTFYIIHSLVRFGTPFSSTSLRPEANSLLNRLRIPQHEVSSYEPLHPVILRKYIAYAKKFIFPTYVLLG